MSMKRRSVLKALGASGAVLSAPTLLRAATPDVVRYGGSAWLGHYPAWIGLKEGHFAAQQLDVRFESFGTTSARVGALLSGDLDLAVSAAPSALAVMARGSRHFSIVAVPGLYGQVEGLLVRSEINNIRELKGRKIGVPFASSAHLLVLDLLDQAALTVGKDVTVLNVAAPELPSAFQSGQIDAAVAWTPQMNAIQAMPNTKLLADDSSFTLHKNYGVNPGPDVLIVRRAYADRNPQVVRRFLKAYFAACRVLDTQPEKAAKTLQPLTNMRDADQLAMVKAATWKSAADQSQLIGADAKYIEGLQKLGELMVKYKQIDKAPAVREWVDGQYLS